MYQGNEVFQLSWKHKLATVKSFKAHSFFQNLPPLLTN